MTGERGGGSEYHTMPGKDHFLFYEKFRETSKLTKEEIQLMLVYRQTP